MILVYPLRVRRATLINYTYLVVHRASREALLIDPGAEADVILEQIRQSNCSIKAILLSHHHQDHTALASFFANCFQVPVFMSAIEQAYHGFTCDRLQPFTPGHVLSFGQLSVFPWHTPGHTRGGVCYQVTDHLLRAIPCSLRDVVCALGRGVIRLICTTACNSCAGILTPLCGSTRGILMAPVRVFRLVMYSITISTSI
ncbi:MBL fold metallo-hydrolase [Paraflavitalea speifideaquila]|uniref:MBL fold metallo-hydrolase n=1 Tax=Paraflavitalea speifideaquila TaxID=3076558 RepID=UPI0028E70FFA|nr:MBL fold metallo-hydrolase [Paraflavitalea speifideiaquila]